jgi:N-acetyl sugar amidotransferase
MYMKSFYRYEDIDLTPFQSDVRPEETRYGLPIEVKYCARCCMSNQRPNTVRESDHKSDSLKTTINFDKNGVCDACNVADAKRGYDWDDRERQLIELCDRYRRDDGRYDCIIPGSGGKDSFYTAHALKFKYGMHPLTITWAPHTYTEWGWRNFQAWIHAGFDNVLTTPNGQVHRLLTRIALENIYHPFQPFVLGQKNLAARYAATHDVELVFYGEYEADYGNPKGEVNSAKRDVSYFTSDSDTQFYLGGVSLADLNQYFGVSRNDVELYLPIDRELLKDKNIDVYYLGYFLPWHPQDCYYYAVEHGGFEPSPERSPGSYSKYSSIDDRIDDLHYYTSHIKFGIGRATSDAAQEVRNNDITREESVALVNRYDGEFPERFIEQTFKYLSISEEEYPIASEMFEQPHMDREYFDHLADRHRTPHLWKFGNEGWRLRYPITN